MRVIRVNTDFSMSMIRYTPISPMFCFSLTQESDVTARQILIAASALYQNSLTTYAASNLHQLKN